MQAFDKGRLRCTTPPNNLTKFMPGRHRGFSATKKKKNEKKKHLVEMLLENVLYFLAF